MRRDADNIIKFALGRRIHNGVAAQRRQPQIFMQLVGRICECSIHIVPAVSHMKSGGTR